MKTRSALRTPHLVFRTSRAGNWRPPARLVRYALFALVAGALVLPLFAHGCHGDDVDHEPAFFPFRINGDD
ncbi:hypothetical protein VT84_31825 [Gemmata sp. SH-PL17]|uniref:hypothetical protein n=1 Tax=Gemmata sp. SH-PL17 TaxID=1630693 RepID=UPI0004B34747|nr:hypothetical protein [Gemmata sp. SH-PL17]AMV29027.1 hypothetical protein VT84_31825 [Gemmata sp. SH-PL17]